MTLFLTFTVLGLVLGSVYAIAASGLVLTYNTSGIFNFAHGAQAMIGAFLYYRLQVVWGVPTLLSVLILLLVVGPLMGFLLHRFIMGGLRDTAEVTKIVVTVGDPARLRVAVPLGCGTPQEAADVEDVLRRRKPHHRGRRRDPLPRDHLPARRRGHRDRPAPAVHPLPDGRADARHRGRPRPAPPQRPRPRADRRPRLGARLHPRGARRHPDHPGRRRRAGGQRARPCWSSTPSPLLCSAGCAASRARSSAPSRSAWPAPTWSPTRRPSGPG